MSLGIVLVGKDGIVLATDTSETHIIGDLITHTNDAHKLTIINNSIGIMAVGNNSDFANWVIYDFKGKIKTDDSTSQVIHSFAVYMSDVIRELKLDISKLQQSENSVEFVISGYENNQPYIYSFSHKTNLPFIPMKIEKSYYWIGIIQIAHYWGNVIYPSMRFQETGVETLKNLAVFMINETSKATSLVGTPIEMALIKPNGVLEKVRQEVSDNILHKVSLIIDSPKLVNELKHI